jgi:hypothetical protein
VHGSLFQASQNGCRNLPTFHTPIMPMPDTLKAIDQCLLPALLTEGEVITYLRLDVDERNPRDRLRNLMRRQALPTIRRGRLQLFRKTAIDEWLDGDGATTMKGSRGRPRHNVNPKVQA